MTLGQVAAKRQLLAVRTPRDSGSRAVRSKKYETEPLPDEAEPVIGSYYSRIARRCQSTTTGRRLNETRNGCFTFVRGPDVNPAVANQFTAATQVLKLAIQSEPWLRHTPSNRNHRIQFTMGRTLELQGSSPRAKKRAQEASYELQESTAKEVEKTAHVIHKTDDQLFVLDTTAETVRGESRRMRPSTRRNAKRV
jgi:hypothetical protein